MIEYEGYQAIVEYQDDVDMLMGRVVNTRDVITFYAESVEALRAEMRVSIDDYLALCEARGIEPARAYSGKFNVRIDPELHRDLAMVAAREGVSLNAVVARALEERV